MKWTEIGEITPAMVGFCCWLASSTASAQSAPTAPGPGESSAPSPQAAPGQTGATPTPALRLFSQPIPREAFGPAFAPSRQQPTPPPRKSWVARHKVLTALLIGATPFVVWGAMVWNSCAGGGC